ncbi:hypothetical protein P154DRAFT_526466, partial [Amniculicola lignicola CBS 123094]
MPPSHLSISLEPTHHTLLSTITRPSSLPFPSPRSLPPSPSPVRTTRFLPYSYPSVGSWHSASKGFCTDVQLVQYVGRA